MILQALEAFYRRKQFDPDPAGRLPSFGLEDKEIAFLLELDTNGQLLGVTDTRSGDGKKKTGQRFLVPQGVKKASGIAANLLWDNAEYVLGLPDTKKLTDNKAKGKEAEYLSRLVDMKRAFQQRIEALPTDAKADKGVQAVLAFIESTQPESYDLPAFAEIKASNPVISFRLHGELYLVCQSPAVVSSAAAANEAEPTGICLVSGKPAEIERLHTAIKGVWGAQTAGANIVSFNLDAFSSYGKSQGSNAPTGKAAVFAYTTALNHLLTKGSRQRIQVGDTSTVFWAEEAHVLEDTVSDLFGDAPKDDPGKNVKAVHALYNAVHTGQFSTGGPATRFHVLGLAPNAARISIRFWETATAQELAQRITAHFADLEIVHADYEPQYLSLFRVLAGLALLNKADNIPPNLGGEVMRAIFEGLPYPVSMLNLAVTRCRAEQAKKDQSGRPLPNVSYARAAAIKGYLNRFIRHRQTNEREFLPMLDPNNPNTAYRLGRLFAVLEKIQEEASPGLNATIRDRYYGAASSTPVTVFTTLLRLKNHHLGKLSAGHATQMEKLLGEVLSEVADFPAHLTLQDQGRFALGYYHQRQAFFTKAEPKTTTEE